MYDIVVWIAFAIILVRIKSLQTDDSESLG